MNTQKAALARLKRAAKPMRENAVPGPSKQSRKVTIEEVPGEGARAEATWLRERLSALDAVVSAQQQRKEAAARTSTRTSGPTTTAVVIAPFVAPATKSRNRSALACL